MQATRDSSRGSFLLGSYVYAAQQTFLFLQAKQQDHMFWCVPVYANMKKVLIIVTGVVQGPGGVYPRDRRKIGGSWGTPQRDEGVQNSELEAVVPFLSCNFGRSYGVLVPILTVQIIIELGSASSSPTKMACSSFRPLRLRGRHHTSDETQATACGTAVCSALVGQVCLLQPSLRRR
jgi:hypothetical protein